MSSRATAQRIAVAAMFVALALIVGLLPTIPGSALKFTGFPLLLAGLLVGPRTGFAIGCLTDLLGFALRPAGWFFPGFTLTQGLTAMIPGLLSRGRDPLTFQKVGPAEDPDVFLAELERRKSWSFNVLAYLRLLGVFGLTQLLTSVLMVSYFTSKFVVGTPLEFELVYRASIQALHVPIYAFLALGALRVLSESETYQRLLKARR